MGAGELELLLGAANAGRTPPRVAEGTATMTMTCHDLAERIEEIHPDADPRDVARLCLLLANHADGIDGLADDDSLVEAWQDISMRLQAAGDQHAAMTEELERLARTDPAKFTMDQIWILLRAIKVQSQVLQLYVGPLPEDGDELET
jgi:hypothetical protein